MEVKKKFHSKSFRDNQDCNNSAVKSDFGDQDFSRTISQLLENTLIVDTIYSDPDVEIDIRSSVNSQNPESNTREENRQYDVLHKQFEYESLAIINDEVPESSIQSGFELYLINKLDINREFYLLRLNQLFMDHYQDSSVIIGILHAISHIEYSVGIPIFQTIGLASLTHKNKHVIDYAIKSFENWENTDAIRLLENVKCHDTLIDNYRRSVISYLRGINESLRKKI